MDYIYKYEKLIKTIDLDIKKTIFLNLLSKIFFIWLYNYFNIQSCFLKKLCECISF